ncbi:uncharacterized protein LOC132314443 [Cornus florida]|uniref:uncharacterized protein LOC132314443 n=1 Tax=Cornus florida TaxID=4283 RepID=UPI00289F84FF|nr:uncharacterized protein LOC132314443 [Cornus florida]XP_059669296.1 uncharacterized protein LOC132314443 [Cornus florida]XP_059669301.1 uncharacterized protein LOC132314443 [Cornus florida]
MPSGAKKRKAAKKKKENNPNISNIATHSQGDDGQKTHDEKESDGSERSSPMSQDHHDRQHSFSEGQEEDVEKRETTSSVRSFVTENKSTIGIDHNNGESRNNEEGDVPKDNFESKNASIEYVESAREARDGRSSSSSSDDESRVYDKKIVVVESGKSKDEASNSIPESVTSVNSVKPVDSLPEVVPQVVDGVPLSKAYNTVVESAPIGVSDKLSFSEEAVQVAESAPIENSVPTDVADENGEKMSSIENKGSEVPSAVMGSQIKEVSPSTEHAAASSDVKGFAPQENKDKLMSFNPPGVDTSSGAEHIKDTEVPECSESQPLVDSAPQVVQTTSLKSCCGLFEVFTGSAR